VIILTDPALPLSGIGRSSSSDGHPAAHGHGWRRELDEALVAGWFHGPLHQHPLASWSRENQLAAQENALAQMGEAMCSVQGPALEARPGGAAWRGADGPNSVRPSVAAPCGHEETGPLAMPRPPERATGGYAVTLPASALGATACMRAPLVESIAPGETVEPVPHELVREPSAAAMRVHVENGPEGVTVWLGLDGDAAVVAARAAAILLELRRLSGPAQRLVNVVCNGTTIYTDAAHLRPFPTSRSRETSWP
jgi:hypothetical protein